MLKKTISLFLDRTGITNLVFSLSLKIYGKHIRVINYHATPEKDMENFESHLKFYDRHYSSVSMADLESFFVDKVWRKTKPGLIISFDDGYRNNFDFARPLLDKYDFIGWFFIPAGLIDSSIRQQQEFAGSKRNMLSGIYKDARLLMSWEELKTLSDKHVIGCHTFTHHRMNKNDSDSILTKEIVLSKELIEKSIEKPIRSFCWVGGEEVSYTTAASIKIEHVGYDYSFMTNSFPVKFNQSPLHIQRTNIETDNSLHLVKFQLSSLMDILYFPKRRRVNKLTNARINQLHGGGD